MGEVTPLGFYAAQQQFSPRSLDATHRVKFQPSSPLDLDPPTRDWYRNLPSKWVQRVQLHKGDPCLVILSMRDGSLLQVEIEIRSKLGRHSGSNIHAVPTFTMIYDSPTSNLASSQWISLELSNGAPITDIKFMLSICYGAFKTLPSSLPAQSDRTIFALTLAASVARGCVQFENNLIESTGSSLREYLAPQFTSQSHHFIGQSLWEKDIATEARNELQKLLFRDSKRIISSTLLRDTYLKPRPNPSGEVDENQITQTTAASIVAWLEFSASQKATSLATWESQWEETWRVKWKQKWEASWKKEYDISRIALIQLGKIVDLNELASRSLTTATSASGRLSGKHAGSTNLETQTVADCAKTHPSSYLEWKTQSISSRNIPGDVEESNPSWLESWRLLRYHGSQQKWLPVWEAAMNLAWALGWEVATKEGQKSLPNGGAPIPQTQEPDQVAPRNFAELVESIMKNPLTWHSSVAEETKRKKESKERMKSDYYENLVDWNKIEALRNHLCEQAKKNADGPGSPLEELARRAFELAKRNNNGVNLANLISAQTTWMKVYSETWERTWKKCWDASWRKVLEETFATVWDRGFSEGAAPKENQESDSVQASSNADGILDVNPPHTERYSQIRSQFRALNALHRTLTHSVPICHKKEVELKIIIAEDKSNIVTSTKSENSRNIFQHRPLTHAQLQNELEKLMKDKLGIVTSEKATRIMNDIWRLATITYISPRFMPGEGMEYSDTHIIERPLGSGHRRVQSESQRFEQVQQTDQPPGSPSWRFGGSFIERFRSFRGNSALGPIIPSGGENQLSSESL